MSLLTTLASRFVAGETAHEAMGAVRALNAQGAKATLNFLGEDVTSVPQARKAADEYVTLLQAIADSGVDANVSVKLSQLGLKLDPKECAVNLGRILQEAERHGNFVRIDMEGSAYTQKTLELFYSLSGEHPNAGVVIQSMLNRSSADVEELNKRGARVRLCKGAYKEPADIAAQDRAEVGRRYDILAELLLGGGRQPAFATHDDARIEHVKTVAKTKALPNNAFEFQMLYGLRAKLWRGLVRDGYTVRIYVPYGTHCVGYLWRRLRERKENLLFVVKSLWQG